VSQAGLAATGSPAAPAYTRFRHSPAAVPALAAAMLFLAIATLPLDRALVGAFAGTVLVVLSVIDVEQGLIPNRIVLPAFALVLVYQLAVFPDRAAEWTLAAVLAAFVLVLPRLFQRAWIGMGDVKLALLVGALLGWGVLGAVLLGFLCTFPIAVVMLMRDGVAARKASMPLGPFLSLGALLVLFAPHLLGLPGS
jgi:prepilin signal peptidase PulO-like enzyme (type II secretory pathway)